MAIYRFSTNSLKTPLKYSSFLAGNSVYEPTLTVDYLVIAGGGGGAGSRSSSGSGGGGGAGGLRSTVTATGGGGTLETALTKL